MARGLWPYADVFDTAFPGIFLLHAPTLLWGGSPFALRIIDLVIQLGAVLLIFETSRRVAGPAAGAMGGLIYAAAYSSAGYYYTAQRDGFAVPLLLGLLLTIASASPGALSKRRLAFAGALLGAACLIRPTYLVFGLAVGVAHLRGVGSRARAGDAVLRLLCFGIPAVAPLALFLAVYAAAGRLDALRDMLLFASTVYPELDRANPVTVVHSLFYNAPQMLWLGAALSLWPRFRPAFRPMGIWAWTWIFLLITLVIRIIESKHYVYQWWPSWALAAVLAGIGFGSLIDQARASGTRSGQRTTVAIVLLLGLVFQLATNKPLGVAFRDLPAGLEASLRSPADEALLADVPGQVAVARYLRDRIPPGHPIQLWGMYPMVYFIADRPPASRFIVPVVFLCVEWKARRYALANACETDRSTALQERFLREYLQDIERKHPYIVARHSGASLQVIEGWTGAPDFPELRALLEREYRVETRINDWTVFRWRGEPK